jgi:DNA processing protein
MPNAPHPRPEQPQLFPAPDDPPLDAAGAELPAELPPLLLAAALLESGYGTTLARRLATPGAREHLLDKARRRLAEAEEALAERGLRALPGPHPSVPVVLWRGPRRAPHPRAAVRDRVAVVGARASDPYGLAVAEALGRDLAAAGATVVSGGAEGCDAAAHLGALRRPRVAMIPTLAVIPGGLDAPYPAIHADLFARILDAGGALVSADWPTTRPRPQTFIARNHVIAALSYGVIVVRARRRSGSLSTAAAATRLGRRLGAVPGALGSPLSEGCHDLLEGGAVAVASPKGAFQIAGLAAPRTPRWPLRRTGDPSPFPTSSCPADDAASTPPEVGETGAAILAALRGEPASDLDSIAARTNLPTPVVAGALIELEIAGEVARGPGGRYIATG